MKEIVTDELIMHVKNMVRGCTYVLRHPTRYTSRECEDLRKARAQAMNLLDQLVVERADKETTDLAKQNQILSGDDIPF